jgi:hypothetical protein
VHTLDVCAEENSAADPYAVIFMGTMRSCRELVRRTKERPMKATLVHTTLVLLLAGSLAAPAAAKPKHSAAHQAAVKQCTEVYEAGAAAAHAPNSPKGSARQTMHSLGEAKKACIAKAPK